VGRQVLISPNVLTDVNKDKRYISINLTKQQIEDSPSLDCDMPVSRQFERSYYAHYGMMANWGNQEIGGPDPNIEPDPSKCGQRTQDEKAFDPHLRSTYDVSGYFIQAKDGEIGHVEDFLIDEVTWEIRYLIIDTQNWLSGKMVLISPKWIERISLVESKVFVNFLRETIKQSPEYTEESLLTRDYEANLHRHYKYY